MPFKVVILVGLEFLLGILSFVRGYNAIEAGVTMNVYTYVFGIYPILPGIPLSGPGWALVRSSDLVLQADTAIAFGVMLVIVGASAVFAAFAFSTVQRWARKLGIIVVVIGAGVDFAILSVVGAAGSFAGLTIEGISLYCLTRRDVRDYFGKGDRNSLGMSTLIDSILSPPQAS